METGDGMPLSLDGRQPHEQELLCRCAIQSKLQKEGERGASELRIGADLPSSSSLTASRPMPARCSFPGGQRHIRGSSACPRLGRASPPRA
jgi:hypothetical protein